MILMTTYGFGRHEWTLSTEQLVLYDKAFFVSLSLYFAAIIFIKMTFLLQYYRLLEVSRLRYVLIGCMVVIFLWGLSQTFVAFLQCIPLEAVWDHKIESKCIKNIAIIWYFNGTFNIVTDFIIITLPIPKIWQLQMPRTQKVVLVGVFMLGLLTIAISILRMQWLNPMPDRTWWNVKPAMWSLAEITCAILCACLPVLKPLIVRAKPLFKPLRSRSSQDGTP
ncbi:Satratoxin biosynthesis SC1 cluster protein 4 [Colletotrichum fructicola]|nr:Satratoxin biosynthesis SC1 cluster protein 4 [Colletotrichum fructicola]